MRLYPQVKLTGNCEILLKGIDVRSSPGYEWKIKLYIKKKKIWHIVHTHKKPVLNERKTKYENYKTFRK